jgi:16S rRNA (adenine1518-N6/adenine1519-N6)-dimethyltransferase
VTGPATASLTPAALRALARRHGITPRKSLGQHFLIEPSLASRIAGLAGVGDGDRVLEIGAGLGSLTVALAATGARVVAVEIDPRLRPALDEVVGGFENVTVRAADALTVAWDELLGTGPDPWVMAANLPYNVGARLVLRTLEEEPRIRRLLVMVQREVGDRLAAAPGDEQYGAASLRVAYHARARVERRVPASVFWPAPGVESVLVRIDRRDAAPVDVDEASLFRVVREAFAQRRKTVRSGLVRLGLSRDDAAAALAASGIDEMARPEELGLDAFGRLTAEVIARKPPGFGAREGARRGR